MEQHPVPQPISSYEFRLIGSMTLKQFAKLAACCLLALIFYGLPLPFFLKWPGIIFFVLLGLGLAFLPINERPLDVWIISFLKAVFSPTQYVWKKENLFSGNAPQPKSIPVGDSLISSPTVASQNQTPGLEEEAAFLENIKKMFETTSLPKSVKPVIQPPKPSVKKRAVAVAKTFQNKIAPPTPAIPNLISGIVKDKEGNVIEGAILEIVDLQGNPLRALKTDKLGLFRIATPLANGTYEIITEKEGYDFDIIKIDLKGEIVQPIEINPK